MKKIAALILVIVLAAAVSLAGADSLALVPGTAANCTTDIFQTYFNMICTAAGYEFTWDEAPVTEDGYDVYTARIADGALEMKLYTQGGNFCYLIGEGSQTFKQTDTAAANTFGTWFGATLGGSLVSLKIGEDGLASISEGNLDTEMQEAIKPLEPILLSAFMSEENLAKIYSQPWIVPGSDASLRAPWGPLGADHPHPRAYGTMPEFYRRVRALGFSREETIARMTSVPARRFGLRGRGVLEKGAFADIAVWSEGEFASAATYVQPHKFASGVRCVMVNGTMPYIDGRFTGERGGRFLER